MSAPDHIRILFSLQQDSQGYPPVRQESLWGKPVGQNQYEIDNIPFFVMGISAGDIVRAEEGRYRGTVRESGNSTIRAVFFDRSKLPDVRKRLTELGCHSEKSHLPNLIAIEIPAEVSYDKVATYLGQLEREQILEYQEAAIRHPETKEPMKP